jgi:hypothetical protein
MKIRSCLVLLLLLVRTGYGQTPGTAIDPLSIQKQIERNPNFNVAALWQRLGISTKLETIYPRVGIKDFDDAKFDHCGNCKAEITRANLDSGSEQELILHVYESWGFSRFLIFKPEGNSWRFVGHADHDFSRYYMPTYRIDQLGNDRYFVTRAQGASGTGVHLQYERWYQLTATGLREVLSFANAGGEVVSDQNLWREFEAHVDKSAAANDAIRVVFMVKFSGSYYLVDEKQDEEIQFFSSTKRGVYMRQPDSTFALQPARSEITPLELRTTFNIDSLSCADFLKIYDKEIARITATPNTQTAKWLAKYRSTCGSGLK